MTNMNRRRALTVLGLAPMAAVLDAQQPAQPAPKTPHVTPNQPAGATPQPKALSPAQRKFFTAKEYRTAKVLADDIIPRDAKSGSASESGALEYMDFHLSVEDTSPDVRTQMRGGLRWLDTETKRRFGVAYASASVAQRHEILDDISWPAKAKPEFSAGVSFFNRFRDMAAAGFFSSPMGWKDLRYEGNTFNPNWQGCPEPAMQKLGVSHAVMDTRIPSQVRVEG
ncbi:MAG: gluconate 2-dehydrogenase subunit 3 family protein [Gemmatirosa sp.]|nr:gluconate 2-dehydrogenase subunit 3 family protein [Gemmatirosa sp.]